MSRTNVITVEDEFGAYTVFETLNARGLELTTADPERDPETDPASIEHILPQDPSGDWTAAFAATEVQAAVERIGNATLLESAVNHDIGGAPYADKRPAYARSAYALTRQVAEMAPEVWSFSLMEKRQRHLAQRAVHVWRADFA